MKSVKSIIDSLIVFGLILALSSCQKNTGPGPSIVKFSNPTATYAEDKGAVNVEVTLNHAQSQDVTINYTWAGADGDTTTYLGGDFSFITPSPLIIKAGQTTGNIQVQIIDDAQIDADDNVVLTLASTSANAGLSGTASDNNSSLTITNNDVAPTSALQVDLTWHLGIGQDGSQVNDINGVNLDLAVQYEVKITNDGITDNGKTLKSSNATSGFETVLINKDDPDSVYYFAVPYITGSSSVTFIVNFNGFGQTNNYGAFTSQPADVNSALFIGPFKKTGATLTFSGSGRSASRGLTWYSFKARDFRVQ